ncbi:MAG: hypothetical protein KJ734_04120 [Chloroflexi bacterium]|nr:hypothetical protein [Chloroflexota bacterium]
MAGAGPGTATVAGLALGRRAQRPAPLGLAGLARARTTTCGAAIVDSAGTAQSPARPSSAAPPTGGSAVPLVGGAAMFGSKGLLSWLLIITVEVVVVYEYSHYLTTAVNRLLAYTVRLLGW